MSDVAGVLLAAGQGRRLGGPKALVEVGGELLVEGATRTLREAGCRPVIVVLGAGGPRVRARARLGDALVLDNPAWEEGMGSSLRVALDALGEYEHLGAVAIALVDQPGVGPSAVTRLTAAWRAGALIAVAGYAGRRGNPVVLDRSLWAAAAAHAVGDRGARDLLDARPDIVRLVPCEDVADPTDLDTPEELEAAQHRWPVRGAAGDRSATDRPSAEGSAEGSRRQRCS
ncbi:nucleotidyltransferase family protein [Egibacter rhizosphaerae]|uniref:Nucleotidyltransferase family protein n=1 Tax=Egibacter rhizosphaerae TaxID=1670831 RepID=A0A411YKR0_9ACTN|nr:nucleotidyltransferase family protein [Egibacter rhizosphaerae]QBI21773.1 nucleotidyltransferase family protein [Egibacter rhizosphaerae]